VGSRTPVDVDSGVNALVVVIERAGSPLSMGSSPGTVQEASVKIARRRATDDISLFLFILHLFIWDVNTIIPKKALYVNKNTKKHRSEIPSGVYKDLRVTKIS
jgi:hypothetical protein